MDAQRELNGNSTGPTGQVDQEKLFEQFFNSDSLDYNSLLATPPAPSPRDSSHGVTAAEVETPETPSATGETPEAVVAEQNEVVAESQPPSQSPDPNSWITALPDDVRANVERIAKEAQLWQQRHQEQASKNRRLHNEVTQLKTMVEAPKAAPATAADEADDVWEQLKSADPILHAALEKKLSALERKVLQESEHKVQERFQPLEQERKEAFIQEQLQQLDSYVPNWREVTQDPMYQSWFEAQTPGTKALYNSLNAVDSARLLRLYADDMERYFGAQQPAATLQQPAAPAANPQATAIGQARQQKLERSAPVQAAPVGVPKQQQLSQDQMFNKFFDDPDAIIAMLASAKART